MIGEPEIARRHFQPGANEAQGSLPIMVTRVLTIWSTYRDATLIAAARRTNRQGMTDD
jgi:hypothetical protein